MQLTLESESTLFIRYPTCLKCLKQTQMALMGIRLLDLLWQCTRIDFDL